MKKHVAYIIIGMACLMFSSCHLTSSNNGDLDGLWQLMTVENLQTGAITDGRDVGGGIRWAFMGDLLSLRNDDKEVFCRFEHAGETLKVYKPYLSGRFTNAQDDFPITDAAELNVFGVYRLEEYFKILQLDGDDMRLESTTVRLTFRKY